MKRYDFIETYTILWEKLIKPWQILPLCFGPTRAPCSQMWHRRNLGSRCRCEKLLMTEIYWDQVSMFSSKNSPKSGIHPAIGTIPKSSLWMSSLFVVQKNHPQSWCGRFMAGGNPQGLPEVSTWSSREAITPCNDTVQKRSTGELNGPILNWYTPWNTLHISRNPATLGYIGLGTYPIFIPH